MLGPDLALAWALIGVGHEQTSRSDNSVRLTNCLFELSHWNNLALAAETNTHKNSTSNTDIPSSGKIRHQSIRSIQLDRRILASFTGDRVVELLQRTLDRRHVSENLLFLPSPAYDLHCCGEPRHLTRIIVLPGAP